MGRDDSASGVVGSFRENRKAQNEGKSRRKIKGFQASFGRSSYESTNGSSALLKPSRRAS
jgi:hypothetical protein